MDRKPLFKRVTQIGLVVRNAEQTARRCWEQFGMGPWTFHTLDPSTVKDMTVHGRRVDHAMRTAHARIGDLDWELIEPLDDNSVYAEHLLKHGEGLHHILFAVEDYSSAKRELQAAGHAEMAHGVWSGQPYSYFDTSKALACIAEIWTPPSSPSTLPPPDATYP